MCRSRRKRPIDVTTASSEIGIKSNVVYTSHVARLIERHTHAHMLHTWGYSSTATTCRRPTTWAVVDRLKRSPSHTRWNGKIARSSVARRYASARLARSHTSSHSSVREKRARVSLARVRQRINNSAHSQPAASFDLGLCPVVSASSQHQPAASSRQTAQTVSISRTQLHIRGPHKRIAAITQ